MTPLETLFDDLHSLESDLLETCHHTSNLGQNLKYLRERIKHMSASLIEIKSQILSAANQHQKEPHP